MTGFAFILILISVFLHAGWNFISKANRPSIAFFFAANAVTVFALLPVLCLTKIPWSSLPCLFWVYFASAVFFEVLYAIGLARAYRKGDISTVYPMVRALPVLSIALITACFHIGKTPSITAYTGFLLVACGCFIMPQKKLSGIGFRCFAVPAMGPVLLAAAGTTGYTIFDKLALSVLNDTSFLTIGGYYWLVELGISLGLLVCIPFSKREKAELVKRSLNGIHPYLCGLFSCAAYLLVLCAMNFVTNVSYLQAFRQMSLPLGAAMGFVFLHEKITLPKIAGILIIVLGLILTVI